MQNLFKATLCLEDGGDTELAERTPFSEETNVAP